MMLARSITQVWKKVSSSHHISQHQTQSREQSLPQQAKSSEPIDLTLEEDLTTKNTTDPGQIPAAAAQEPVFRGTPSAPEGSYGPTTSQTTEAGTSDDKRKLVDADGNEHVYPTNKRQGSANDIPSLGDAQFSKSSRHHLSVLVRLASLYTQKLNALGCQQLAKSSSGETISDDGWENQHRSYLVSALFCLETAARFVEKLRSVPNAFELLQMNSSHGDKFEIQLRIKLSMLLLNYTNSHRRAEFHLIQALALSQKNFSPKEHFYGVKMQLANLYARIGSIKHAESSLKDCISEAQSLGLKDWAYAMSFQLANLPRCTQPSEILSKLHNMAFAANDYGMMAVASLKAVLHHLKQQNLATLASQLPKLKEWFESSNDSNVAALKPCFYLLDTLHMIMSGDFSNRKDRTSSLQALVETWNSLPEESEFQFKFSLASQIPDQPAPVQLRFCWMSRRQMMALLYFIIGLLLKPSANTLFGAKALSQTVESAINNFKNVPGGLFIPGFIERRQTFYVHLIILSRLHLSDLYTAREDFQAAHQIIHNVVDLCSRNGLWDKFGPLALHAKGQLAQSQSQFESAFLFYKSALQLATDRSLMVTIAFNVLMLAIPDHANPSPKLASVFEAIQAACPEPRLIPVESGMWLLSAIFANTMIAKKNYLSRALSLSKLSLNDQSIYLLNVLSAVLFAATNPETAEKILTQLLRSQQKLKMDIGAITASTILCKLSESKADQAAYNVNKSILEKCVASYREKCKVVVRN
ncbi:mau2 chromatid cohesion factor [Entomophthora muscae]|uniref:Mau2 chromatid cohesion factor n=1 Tax=Entomophthora muscae TaxID=34485 RepID=A0ACC2RNT5_9FUNG|nr:mau2 chromatid cohesion factor [Entomophthora muscae]